MTHNLPFMAACSSATVIEVSTHNVVCGGSVGAQMPLETLATFEGAMYDPVAFPGVKFRMNNATVMIFGTGKVVVVGAVTAEGAYRAMDMVVQLLRQHNISMGVVSRRIHNVVTTASLGCSLDLASISMSIPRSLYEPEHFPGVIIRQQDPKCTVLLFASGKLVCVGANSVEAATNGVNQLYARLQTAGLI